MIGSTSKIQQETTLVKYSNKLSCPVEIDEEIYCVSESGDIIKLNQRGQAEVVFTILGHPSSICFSGVGKGFLVSDFAHQSIFIRENEEKEQIHNLITQYNERAFNGPNSIKAGNVTNSLYFTDSGPFFETSLQNCTGSLYVYRFQDKSLRALSHRNLAYPCGMEIQEDQKYLLVCEMGNNQILKFILDEDLSGNSSVFHRFNGRLGPSSISYYDQIYYVTLYEFRGLTQYGVIALLNKSGQLLQKVPLSVGPEITGIFMLNNESSSGGPIALLTEGNNLHQISFKGDRTESRQESVVMDKK